MRALNSIYTTYTLVLGFYIALAIELLINQTRYYGIIERFVL